MIHRDIKPGNIFLTETGTVKLVDFGLARLASSELTRSNVMMGTIDYMSPEQVRGERADHRADIFSTGVVFYELLSGRRAFEGESYASTITRFWSWRQSRLAEIDPALPGEVIQIVERALAKPKDERKSTRRRHAPRPLGIPLDETAMDSPAVGRRIPSDTRLASQMPTVHTPSQPVPLPTDRVEPNTPAPQTAAPARRVPTIPLAAGAAVLAIAAALIWAKTGRQPPLAAAAPPAAVVATEPPVSDVMQQALSAFEAEDYAAAERGARAVLARDPAHAVAQRLLERTPHSRRNCQRRPQEGAGALRPGQVRGRLACRGRGAERRTRQRRREAADGRRGGALAPPRH